MTKQYTVSEVLELQNQRQQLEQRLAVHTQRAEEKRKELQEIFLRVGVKDLQELSNKCAELNAQMQAYAEREETTINMMKETCDEFDRLL